MTSRRRRKHQRRAPKIKRNKSNIKHGTPQIRPVVAPQPKGWGTDAQQKLEEAISLAHSYRSADTSPAVEAAKEELNKCIAHLNKRFPEYDWWEMIMIYIQGPIRKPSSS